MTKPAKADDRKTAGKTAGRPFAAGADPRRGVGKPGRSGRRPDEVRVLCRQAFDVRRPRLEALADSAEPGIALKALDMLAKYGGMSYSEAQRRAEATLAAPRGEVRVYELPSNGKGAGRATACA